jgi:Endonuclease related to archaeal Holliday junction resolvase
MLPLINPPPFLWFFLIAAAALLAGAVIFFLGILKGNEIEARLQRRSQKLSRSILSGVFSEQIAPFLPDFPKKPESLRSFIGKPVDFLVFKGMDDQHIDEVVFVEIKSGNSQLSPNERTLRYAIEAKRVRWQEYRVDHTIADMPAPTDDNHPPPAVSSTTNAASTPASSSTAPEARRRLTDQFPITTAPAIPTSASIHVQP